jgi:superfamily I DNA/RNA helicase
LRVLSNIRPTGEQLLIINDYRPGAVVVRGAAGSGKTTTAVLRLRHVTNVWRNAAERADSDRPVRVLVLTFNRTLRGYVEQLVRKQVRSDGIDLQLDTFARWAQQLVGRPALVPTPAHVRQLARLAAPLGLPQDFVVGEADYVTGRYAPGELSRYLDRRYPETYRRHGRGASPHMTHVRRRRLIEEVVEPYAAWKRERGLADWNDVAVRAAAVDAEPYDVVVVDEAQDFSANMVRAVLAQLSDEHSCTFVLDAAQRVYPHGFTWKEVGLDLRPGRDVFTLRQNHRNTRRIAAFARPLVEGLPLEDDGTIPDFDACEIDGELPVVVRGHFAAQMDWVVRYLRQLPADESVGILHPKGGGWFDYVRSRLDDAGIAYVDLQRRRDWPQGPPEVGLSTLHSVKGLEFDHVVITGLEDGHMPHGEEEDDTQLAIHRRLLAMAIGRARRTVCLTCKPDTEPGVMRLLDPATYRLEDR